jgi:hypothetical protein
MAGKITVSTLNDDTGVLATQNGMTGIPKAWVNFNGNTFSVRGSFNVSSITNISTGVNQVNFTTAMPNANYACSASSASGTLSNSFYIASAYVKDANGCWVWSGWGTTNYNVDYVTVIVVGS